jgi:hypothetical protein
MDSTFPYLRILAFLGVFALFLLPGYLWAWWLTRQERFGAPFRAALGFALSMAFFGSISWPFLWFGWSFHGFLVLLYPVWGGFLATAAVAWFFGRRLPSFKPKEALAAAEEHSEGRPVAAPSRPRKVVLVLACCLGLGALAGIIWADSDPSQRFLVLFSSPVLFALVSLGARWVQRRCGSLLRFTPEDEQPPSRLWTMAAAGLIVFQAGTAVVYDRPDWDDHFYLSAVMDYQHAESLNSRNPVSREPAEMHAVYRALCWELWGAVACSLTGLNAMAVFHSLLPGILVLLVYGAYTGVLAEYLPRRWVPLALLGLSAFHLWGIGHHDSAANHLLPRLWQGKAVLIHLGVPLTIVLLTRYMAQPTWQRWLLLLASVLFGLAVSFSAIFMVSALLACLGLALALAEGLGKRQIRALVGAALAAAPLVACGLVVRANVQLRVGSGDIGGVPVQEPTWFSKIVTYTYSGSAEVIWLFTLPLMAALVRERRQSAYFVLFPALLALTFINPFLFRLVATQFTSYATYYRLLWLFPVGTGLAALLALTVRFLLLCWGVSARRTAALGVAATALALVGTFLLPGIYVWSPRNSFIGPLGTPHLAENLEKMPADLIPIAKLLEEDPTIAQGRILCNLEAASFLAPCSLEFRFVQTRPNPYGPSPPGRPVAGLEPYLLLVVLQEGRFPPLKDEGRWQMPLTYTKFEWEALGQAYGEKSIKSLKDAVATDPRGLLRDMLEYHKVNYVLFGPGNRSANLFEEVGCRLVCRRGQFSLWRVPTGDSNR